MVTVWPPTAAVKSSALKTRVASLEVATKRIDPARINNGRRIFLSFMAFPRAVRNSLKLMSKLADQ
jgi:hypothetical protein